MNQRNAWKKNNKKLHIHKEDLLEWHLRKESIDARKQNDFHFNCCVDCKVKNEDTLLKKKSKMLQRLLMKVIQFLRVEWWDYLHDQ